MNYSHVKEADGTYTIRSSYPREILFSGVRGCNVDRILTALYAGDYDEARREANDD